MLARRTVHRDPPPSAVAALAVRRVGADTTSMGNPYLSPYEDPAAHAHISALIREHSSNLADVRGATMRSLDFSDVEEVLDLGCGFGFWTEDLAGRVAPGARFTGIDACDGNEASYLRTVEAQGRRARFICAHVDACLPFEDDSFDLVLAAYSLYFFAGILPEVDRVLRPGGRFVAVTHSEGSLAGLLSLIDLPREDATLMRLLGTFSAENGRALLAGTFSEVERVDYLNRLTFSEDDGEDLMEYLRFKIPLLLPGVEAGTDLPVGLLACASDALHRCGRVIVEKDDALFVCGGSRVH
jgi:SAM-dependent methyltransferase